MEINKGYNEYYNNLKIEIHNSKLGSIKNMLLELFKLINNPSCSARELKELIELDPPLTMKILKLANSAYYGTFRKLTDIQEAVVWLGFDTVKHLALSMKILEMFDDTHTESRFSRLNLWKSSITSAFLGKTIYRREFCKPSSFIYSAGLLHNIGIIFLDQFRNMDFNNIYEQMLKTDKDLYCLEIEAFGFDHATLAADIMEEWGFPINIADAVRFHHNPVSAPKLARIDTFCLFLIDEILKQEKIGFAESNNYNHFKLQSAMKFLNLTPENLKPILEYVKAELEEMQDNGILH